MCWFDCHRRFTEPDHRFRNNKTDFKKGRRERRGPPVLRDGYEILDQINNMGLMKITEVGAEEHNAAVSRGLGWKKKSIFWDLPYWPSLLLRHNLDVMHIEKNVFDNIFFTILDVPGKLKDKWSARKDIKELCKRPELEPDEEDNRYPKACYALDRHEKQVLLDWLRSVKFPDGYVSNLSHCIDLHKLRLFGMKSHDCHVFMQRLMHVAFRPFLDDKVWEPIAQLSAFFRDLMCYELKPEVVMQLHKEIPIILCKLERIFPPALFDSMEHLPIHLPREAALCGPVNYRWMYLEERYV